MKKLIGSERGSQKRKGQVATIIGATAEAIVWTGIFDDRPAINAILHALAFLFGAKAARHGYKMKADAGN